MPRTPARHVPCQPIRTTQRAPPRQHGALKLFAIIVVLGLAAGTGFQATTAQAQALTASLAGNVTDSDGAPLADAQVILKRQVTGSSWLYHETRTGANGGYTLNGLEPGTWNLSFRLDGYRSKALSLSLGAGDGVTQNAELVAIGAAFYRGTVRDAETNDPIQGAHVKVSSWTQIGQQTREATTGSDGKFQVRLFASENSISLTKGGYGTFNDRVWSPGEDIERDIKLHAVPPQSATITGRAIDGNGNGIAAYISMWPDWNQGRTRSGGGAETDAMYYDSPAEPGYAMPDMWWPGGQNHNNTVSAADGSFRMQAYPGDVIIEANRVGYLVARSTATLTADGSTELTLTLERLPERSVALSGTVRNAQNGTPIPGADLNIQVPAAGDYAWATTDRDGRFEVKVRPGYTMIEVNYWSWGGHMHYDYDYDYHYVEAHDMEGDRDEGVSSEEGVRGSSMPVPPDHEDVPQGETRYHPTTRIITTQANSAQAIDLELTPRSEPTTRVVGYIVDTATNQAIPHARVALQNHDTGDWGDATADGDGSFEFKTNAGYHTLRAYAEGYLPFAMNVQVQGSGTQRIDLLVAPGEWANEGWWSPDGQDDGGHYAMPRSNSDAGPAEEAMDHDASERATSAADFDTGAPRALRGGPGGLGPYTPMTNDPQGIPAPGLVALLLVIAALGVAARRRR